MQSMSLGANGYRHTFEYSVLRLSVDLIDLCSQKEEEKDISILKI